MDGFFHVELERPPQEAAVAADGKPWLCHRSAKWKKAMDGFFHVELEPPKGTGAESEDAALRARVALARIVADAERRAVAEMFWWHKTPAWWELPGCEHFHALGDVGPVAVAIAWIAPGKLFENRTPIARSTTGVATGVLRAGRRAAASTAGTTRECRRGSNEYGGDAQNGNEDRVVHDESIGHEAGRSPMPV